MSHTNRIDLNLNSASDLSHIIYKLKTLNYPPDAIINANVLFNLTVSDFSKLISDYPTIKTNIIVRWRKIIGLAPFIDGGKVITFKI